MEDLAILAASLPLLEAEAERRRREAELEAVQSQAEAERRASYKIHQYFRDDGPFRRELYPKHLQFFRGGATHLERLFLKANRVGGTEAGAYEVTSHLTGIYPPWWEGRRFSEPGEWWAAGDTGLTTRDILQVSMMGDLDHPKTGMLPAHLVKHYTPRNGVPKGIETVWVSHASGGVSSLQFKSFDQGRRAFQGTKKQGVWLDEEMPAEVYTECLLRTMNTEGLMIVTFTPLQGLTEFVDEWLKTSDMVDADGQIIPAYEGVWRAVGVELPGGPS